MGERVDGGARSPCVGACGIGPDGWCVGCGRTGDEVARWRGASDAERAAIAREAARRIGGVRG